MKAVCGIRSMLKRSCLVGMLIPVVLFCQGCYEGWETESVAGPEQPNPNPQPETKLIYYILYQPIYLNENGLADSTCFPETGVRDYRQNEWSKRSASLEAAMNKLAEKVVVADLGISADDCETLALVRNASISKSPWGEDEPGTDALERPIIHVKAVFYDGEPQATPPSSVTAEHWAAMQDLVFAGRDARSKHYFVLANPENGYFSEWRSAIPESVVLNGTPIDNVDPTPDGITSRDNIISADTSAFSSWLTQ